MPARYAETRPDHWPEAARKQLQERIVSRMEKLGLNALQVAQASGVSNSIVYDILSDRKKSPSVRAIVGLASGLKCSVAWLVGEGEGSGIGSSMSIPLSLTTVPVRGRAERGAYRLPPMNERPPLSIVAPRSRQYPEADCFAVQVADDHLTGLQPVPVTAGMIALCLSLVGTNIAVETGRCYLVHRRSTDGPQIETAFWRATVFRDRVEFAPVTPDPEHNAAEKFVVNPSELYSPDGPVFVEGLFYAALADYDGAYFQAWP